jgi:pimeloyl-ACP methyl ester carboxylesterase
MSTAIRKADSKIEGLGADEYGPQGRSEWLDVDWSRHLRWVEVAGRQVNVCEIGQGPPLVFVHGHSGNWQNWLENIPHFARSHRVVAMDLPGFGESEMPVEHISIESYARTLDELFAKLDIESAPVVGNSMGGFVAAQLCVSHPVRVSGIVLVSAAGLSTKYMGLSAEFFRRKSVQAFARATNAYAAVPEARAQTLVRRSRLRRAMLQMVLRHPDRIPAAMCVEMIRGSGRPAAPDATQALMSYDFSDKVREISCPALIVWGESDRVVPVEAADAYERAIPNARKVIFPDTGHVPMIERPAAFNALLDEFLASL